MTSSRVLRGVSYGVLPAELALVISLAAGIRVPWPVLMTAEILVAVLLLSEVGWFLRLRRQGMTRREALRTLVPGPVWQLTAHELRLHQSLVLWFLRRRHGVGTGDQAFGRARDQAAMMYGLVFVCVLETVGVSVLLADQPVAHAVMLILDVYSVLLLLGFQAASCVRPHVLSGDTLRLRHGAHIDVRIPLGSILALRHQPLFSHPERDGELNLPIGSQTSLIAELAEPVNVPGLLGRPRIVKTIRFHADDPRALHRAVTEAGVITA